MAEVEITQEEISGIDVNQVASMQLKDGTVVVVQGEGKGEVEAEYDNGNLEFSQYEMEEQEDYQAQSNQLRARPMMVVAPPRPLHPKPIGVPVVPVGRPVVRPPVPMKPVPPRGPLRPGVPVVFRTRPGMPVLRPQVVPKPVVKPGMPVPVVRPPVPGKPVPLVKPGFPVKPVVAPVRPLVPGPKPLVAPGVVFRARPGEAEAVEDYDFQEEEYAEDEYYDYDDQAQDEDYQLRAKPLVVPMGAPRPAPMGMKPRVVPVPGRPVPVPVVAPKPVMVPGPKRGPVRPVVGLNTFQPKVFRTRPVVRPPMATFRPMAPPMVPPRGVRPPVPGPKRYAYGFGPVLRSRPRSSSYDPQEYAEENEYQYTEGCESSVCTKCGKEF